MKRVNAKEYNRLIGANEHVKTYKTQVNLCFSEALLFSGFFSTTLRDNF